MCFFLQKKANVPTINCVFIRLHLKLRYRYISIYVLMLCIRWPNAIYSFLALAAVLVMSSSLWDIIMCSLVKVNRSFCYTGSEQNNGNTKKLRNWICVCGLHWKNFGWKHWNFFSLFRFCSACVSKVIIWGAWRWTSTFALTSTITRSEHHLTTLVRFWDYSV
jgi:hypothetical protein